MDVFNILHIRAGNIIEIPSKPLFVEEACSGVDSQYALMAVAGVWLLVGKSNLWVSLCTIITVPIWAILGNLLRIFSIVVGLEFFNVDLSVGTSHTILGLLVFCVAAYAHWSSVQVFNYFNELVDQTLRSRTADNSFGAPRMRFGSSTQAIEGSRYWFLFFVPMLPLTLIAFSGVIFAEPLDYSLSLEESIIEKFPGRHSFPIQIQDFQQSSYRDEVRDRNDLLGQYSRIWSYTGQDGQLLVASLDFPFRGWHPLWECYETAGWTRLQTTRVDKDDSGSEIEWPFFEVSLSSKEQEFGLLIFSLFDQFGKPYDFDGSFEYRLEGSRFKRSIFDIAEKIQSGRKIIQEPITIQFQTLFTSEEPLNKQAKADRRQKFLKLRDEIYRKSATGIQAIR